MDFKLADETVLVKNSARQYLKEKCPSSVVREMIKDETGFSRKMWKEMAQLGWPGMLYEEQYGGSAESTGSFFDFFIICEETGRVLLPSPLFCSAVLSGLLLDTAGNADVKKALLPAIVEGQKIFTTALLNEQGRSDHHDPAVQARRNADGSYALSGTRILVPYAHVADAILLCAQTQTPEAKGPCLFLVDGKTPGRTLTPLETMSGGKSFAVTYDGARVGPEGLLGEPGRAGHYVDSVLPRVTALRCGEMLGGMQRTVEMTVNYVKERKQFGAPLGSLQAVQHHCADMATWLESSRLIAYQAASLIGDGMPAEKETAMAKAWCSDAYKKCTWIGHQLHGGIGFTEEFDMHLYYKHAKECELLFGDARFHRSRVADALNI